MSISFYDYCDEYGKTDLLDQWHPTKNGALTPGGVTYGSKQQVWWQCEKGHEWQAQVKSRVSGTGCPVCANRIVVPGVNDLETISPNLAAQWHPTKNGSLTPKDFVGGTRKKVWWQCEKGHEWQAAVASRMDGSGCPVCAGKVVIPGVNDLASKFPLIAAQWHPTKNGAMTPEQVSPYSNRKVWWLCPQGHTYQAGVAGRTSRDSNCPYCTGRRALPGFNDLVTVAPEVAAQWHPTLNERLTPEQVTIGSHQKAWWICSFGHVWKAAVYSRTGKEKCGCPVCAGKVNSSTVRHSQRTTVSLLKENRTPAPHIRLVQLDVYMSRKAPYWGQFYHAYREKGTPCTDPGDFLLKLDALCREMDAPAVRAVPRDDSASAGSEKSGDRNTAAGHTGQPNLYRILKGGPLPTIVPEDPLPRISIYIHILRHQSTSMQGYASWQETAEPVFFNNVLELLYLIRDAASLTDIKRIAPNRGPKLRAAQNE